ncbi:hypothetical protein [uncultured Pelagimonas sp.]|nr:hypothetical protein [uncultured Pelagimonas sp.]
MLKTVAQTAGKTTQPSQEVSFSFSLGLPRFRNLESFLDLIEHAGGADT